MSQLLAAASWRRKKNQGQQIILRARHKKISRKEKNRKRKKGPKMKKE